MQDYVILINLDDGVCHALARRLRAESIYCRIMPAEVSADEVLRANPRGVILARGCAGQAANIPQMIDFLQMGLPMLCLGDAALTLCKTLGGTLDAEAESGIITVTFDPQDSLFDGVEDGERYLPVCRGMTFGEDQGNVCATADQAVVGLRVRQRDVYGLSFPLERNDPATIRLLLNFCREKCGCTQWWTERAFIGMAETTDPASNKWTDKGFVICSSSDKGKNWARKSNSDWDGYFKFNAIDPSFIITPNGEHWLIYGS